MAEGEAQAANLWALADREGQAAQGSRQRSRNLRWALQAMLPLSLGVIAAIGVMLPQALPAQGRTTLFVFALALILWSTTRFNASYVALAATMALVLAGAMPQAALIESLASDVVWLMIGAFVLGGAVQHSGLAARLTGQVARRARTVSGAFWWVTAAVIPLSLFIPSTSGRAAVTLPVFRGIAGATTDAGVTRALALLIPSVILVATIATLVGAGSHLIANDLLHGIAGRRIGFAEWLLYGLPFAIVAAGLTCAAVLRLFLTPAQRVAPLSMTPATPAPWSRAERTTLAVAAAMFVLWSSEPWHGLEIATVAVAGALLLAAPGIGVLRWKDALRAVSWNLVLFVGAALVLGDALIRSGAAAWITESLFAASGIREANSSLLLLLLLALITLTSHLYMTSHAARAVALVPGLLVLATQMKLDPAAVMFIGTIGMNYCLTFPVSSKALLLYQEVDGESLHPSDLLKLSAAMLPLHVGLIVVFYYGYWQWVGLAL